MFNDIGVIGTTRTASGRQRRAGLPGVRRRWAGRTRIRRWRSRTSHPRELLPTLEAILRVFSNHGNRDNKLRARMKWLVDTMGWEELQDRVVKERRLLLGSSSWPGGVPDEVVKAGDAAAGVAAGVVPTPMGHGTPVQITAPPAASKAGRTQRGPGARRKGTVSAIAYARLGDVTSEQFRALAAIQRSLGSKCG